MNRLFAAAFASTLLVLLSLASPAKAQWTRVVFPSCTSSQCAPTDGLVAAPGWALAADEDRSYTGGGFEGAFVVSTDGGASWTERRYTFDPLSAASTSTFVTVEAGTAYAWMQSADGIGVHTSPDGQTWTRTGAPYAGGGEIYLDLRRHDGALFARSHRTAGRRVWRSADLGRTWSDVTGTLAGDRLTTLLGSAGRHLMAVVLDPTNNAARVWSTPDGGATWTRRDADFPVAGGGVLFGRYVSSGLARVGAATLVGYSTVTQQGAAFVETRVRRSVDGGASFSAVALPALATGSVPGDVESFAVLDGQTVFANTNEAIFLSRDAGATWTRVDERRGTNNDGFVGTIHTDGRTLYVAHSDFVERRPLSDFGLTTSADPAPTTAGLTLTAGPNPARGRVQISLARSEPGPVRLSVFDALGRTAAVLHDGEAPAVLTVPLDSHAFAPGVYIVRADAPGVAVSRSFAIVR